MKAQKVLGWLSFLSLFFGVLIQSVYEYAQSAVQPNFSGLHADGTVVSSELSQVPSSWVYSLLDFHLWIEAAIILLAIIFLISFISYLVIRLKKSMSSALKR